MKTNKTILRRIACLVLVICFSVLALASCGKATPNADDANGSFGSITWDYKKDTKTLTLTGAGAIGDVDFNEDNAPWAGDVRMSAEKIVVNEGITSVGTYALWGFANVTQISLPSTLTAIGDYGFAYCSKLASVNFPAALTSLGKGAFEGCGALSAIFLPEGIKTISENAFAFCSGLKGAIIMGAPLTVEKNAFRNCHALTSVVVRSSVSTTLPADALTGIEDPTKIAVKQSDNATGKSNITITYKYDDGTVINTVTKPLDLYATLTEPTPAIEGYTADKTSVTVTGSAVDETITVTYTKNAPVETEPVESTEPIETEPEEEKNPLSSIIAIVIMVLVLAGIGVGAFFLIRSDKKKGNKGGTVRKNNKK